MQVWDWVQSVVGRALKTVETGLEAHSKMMPLLNWIQEKNLNL
jgi:hypothetical protein